MENLSKYSFRSLDVVTAWTMNKVLILMKLSIYKMSQRCKNGIFEPAGGNSNDKYREIPRNT